MDYDQKFIFPIMRGIEVALSNKTEQQREQCVDSELVTIPSTLILQKSAENDIFLIYQSDKQLPMPFAKQGHGIIVLLNPNLMQYEDMQAFPEVWDFVQNMGDKFRVAEQFCAIKLSPQMNEIFMELEQIPIPPTMFRFFVQLKVIELILWLSTVNQYGKQVHFYPYPEI